MKYGKKMVGLNCLLQKWWQSRLIWFPCLHRNGFKADTNNINIWDRKKKLWKNLSKQICKHTKYKMLNVIFCGCCLLFQGGYNPSFPPVCALMMSISISINVPSINVLSINVGINTHHSTNITEHHKRSTLMDEAQNRCNFFKFRDAVFNYLFMPKLSSTLDI